MLRLFTGRPHQTLSQVTLLGSLRGCLNKSAEELFWPQERNRRCPMFRDLMLFRAGAVQFAGPGGPLPLFAHDPEPHVISSLPDLPPKAQHVALQRLYSHVVQLCLRTDLSILIGLRTLCLFLEAETRRFDHTREHRLADSAFLKKLEHSTKLAKLASRYIKIQRSQQVVEAKCRSHRAKAFAEALHRETTSNVVAGHPAGLSAWMPEQVSGRVVLATGKESSLPNVSRLDAFSGWRCAICRPWRASAFVRSRSGASRHFVTS